MERSPLFLAHKKAKIQRISCAIIYAPFYDQFLGEAATRNLYLDCKSRNHKSSHVDHLKMNSDRLEDYPSPK